MGKVKGSSNLRRYIEDMCPGSRGSWEDHLSLIEFAYDDSYGSCIEATPYEILHVEDQVLFKCLHGRGCYVLAKSKFDPPYIGSFEIVGRLDQVTFRQDLPVEASRMHTTCHVTNMMICLAESELRAKYLYLFSNVSFEERAAIILKSSSATNSSSSGADKAERSSIGAGSGTDYVRHSLNGNLGDPAT
ncbi:hypothetical protein OSB04_028130 [Centaurea solstitialis]|uniref:Tf2-1-like SH3-like domain-containing protein n=1 Tax=Centaurea solstitialis TaxID=347529 RepID=A0AA38W8Y1_9ASTR|nr:hypothetical protein OSB04_028130 [Centaurea solstitialis]